MFDMCFQELFIDCREAKCNKKQTKSDVNI